MVQKKLKRKIKKMTNTMEKHDGTKEYPIKFSLETNAKSFKEALISSDGKLS